MEATTAWLFCIVFIFEAFLAQKNVEIFGKRHPVEEMSVEYRGWFRVPHPESVGFFLATNEICSRTLSYSRTKPPPPPYRVPIFCRCRDTVAWSTFSSSAISLVGALRLAYTTAFNHRCQPPIAEPSIETEVSSSEILELPTCGAFRCDVLSPYVDISIFFRINMSEFELAKQNNANSRF